MTKMNDAAYEIEFETINDDLGPIERFMVLCYGTALKNNRESGMSEAEAAIAALSAIGWNVERLARVIRKVMQGNIRRGILSAIDPEILEHQITENKKFLEDGFSEEDLMLMNKYQIYPGIGTLAYHYDTAEMFLAEVEKHKAAVA